MPRPSGSGWIGSALGFLPTIVGWLVAALLSFSVLNSRVAVLETHRENQERRLAALEADRREQSDALRAVKGSLDRIEQRVVSLDTTPRRPYTRQ